MSGTKLVLCRLAAIAAAAAFLPGCGGGDMSNADCARADVRVRTPLVDDDGWPMPADVPPADVARPATTHGSGTR